MLRREVRAEELHEAVQMRLIGKMSVEDIARHLEMRRGIELDRKILRRKIVHALNRLIPIGKDSLMLRKCKTSNRMIPLFTSVSEPPGSLEVCGTYGGISRSGCEINTGGKL